MTGPLSPAKAQEAQYFQPPLVQGGRSDNTSAALASNPDRDNQSTPKIESSSLVSRNETTRFIVANRASGIPESSAKQATGVHSNLEAPVYPANTVGVMPDGSYAVAKQAIGVIGGFAGFNLYGPNGQARGSYEAFVHEEGNFVGASNLKNKSDVPGALDLLTWYLTKHSDKENFRSLSVINEKVQAVRETEYKMKLLVRKDENGEEIPPSAEGGSYDYERNAQKVNETAEERLQGLGWTLAPEGGLREPGSIQHRWIVQAADAAPVDSDGHELEIVAQRLEDGSSRFVTGKHLDANTFAIIDHQTGVTIDTLSKSKPKEGQPLWRSDIIAGTEVSHFIKSAQSVNWKSASTMMGKGKHWVQKNWPQAKLGERTPADKARDFVRHIVENGKRLYEDFAQPGYHVYRLDFAGQPMLLRALLDDAGNLLRVRRALPLDMAMVKFKVDADKQVKELREAGWTLNSGHANAVDPANKEVSLQVFDGTAAHMALKQAHAEAYPA